MQSLQRFFKVLSSPGAVALLVDKLKSAGFFPLLLVDDHIERSGADGIHVGGAIALACIDQRVVIHIFDEFIGKQIVQRHQLAILAVFDDAARGVEQHVGGRIALDGGRDGVRPGGEVDGLEVHLDVGILFVERFNDLLLVSAGGIIGIFLPKGRERPPGNLCGHLGGVVRRGSGRRSGRGRRRDGCGRGCAACITAGKNADGQNQRESDGEQLFHSGPPVFDILGTARTAYRYLRGASCPASSS